MSSDILEELTAEHADVRRMFSAFTGLPFHDPERKQLVEQATASLTRQARVEESCLYPLADELPDGGQTVRQSVRENGEIEALLVELSHSDQDTPGFDRLVGQLVERATAHANREEAQLFPALRSALSAEQLAAISERADGVRHSASVQPRPGAVRELPPDDLPPAERTPVQRFKDLLSPAGRGQQPGYSAPAGPFAGEHASRVTPDVIALLLEQHAEVRSLLRRVGATNGEERRRAFEDLRWLLTVHETGEQQVLRPVSAEAAGQGIAEARVSEELEADEVLRELSALDPDSDRFESTFEQFRQSVLDHATHEENEEFPAVLARCSADDLRTLGQRLLEAERTAGRSTAR